MAVYTLSGAGTQSLTADTAAILIDVLTYAAHRKTGQSTPTNYYDLGLIRFGYQGYFERPIPLDAAQQRIWVPRPATTIGWNLFEATSIKVTEQTAVQALPPDALSPWDRNPTPINRMSTASAAGGSSNSTVWTYTVPTARLFILAHANAELYRWQAPSGASTPAAFVQSEGNALVQAWLLGGAAGFETTDSFAGSWYVLPAGHVITGGFNNNDVGGSVIYTVSMQGTEFDV